MPSAVAEASARHEDLQIRASRILGMEPTFLEVLDMRLREALSEARVRELDALVLAAAGSSDPLANQAVARLARVWGARHKLPVTAAFASTAPPATGEAVRAFRGRAAGTSRWRRCSSPPASCPTGPPSWRIEAGAVAVSEPLGADPELARADTGPLRRGRRRARPRLTPSADPSQMARE